MAKKYKKTDYPEPKRVRVGRTKTVIDMDGKTPLNGLAWDKGTGQYYFAFFKQEKDFKIGRKTKKDYCFGVHYEDAVNEFKTFMKDNQEFILTAPTAEVRIEQEVKLPLTAKDKEWFDKFKKDFEIDDVETPDALYFGVDGINQSDLPNAQFTSHIKIDKKYALHYIKQLLSDEEIKIEVIRMLKLDDLLPTEHKRIKIQNLLDYYLKEVNPGVHERKKVKAAIKHFLKITKKQYVNDLNEDDLKYYNDMINNEYIEKSFSSSWRNGRVDKVATVFNFPLYPENNKYKEERPLIRQIHDKMKEQFKNVDDEVECPAKTLDVKTITKLFKRAKEQGNSEILLMMLLMLNTSYTPVDIRGLQKKMILEQDDFTYILFPRAKTKKRFKRVNCLWDITAKLLQKHIEQAGNKSPYVFVTSNGGPYAESTLNKHFRKFFNNPEEITHPGGDKIDAQHFKDTVITELAFKVKNSNMLKITIGHREETRDQFWKYVDKKPEQQKPASDILYDKL